MRALFELPNDEARRVLARGATAYLLINPVEYHGPHLSLHNDRLISLGLVKELHDRIGGGAPCLVAADLEMGVEPTPGPGSRHTPYQVARAQIREATRALVELGATRLVFMTFHGAALHSLAIDAGVREAEALGARAVSPMHVLLHDMIHADDLSLDGALAHVRDEALRREMLDGVRYDFHAGFFETSLTLLYAPHSVSPIYRALPACPTPHADVTLQLASKAAALVGRHPLARELAYAAVVRGWSQMRPFYGYTGWPAQATVESGRFFADLLIDRYARVVPAVLDGKEPSPEPILRWVEGLSMGGRLGGNEVAMSEVFSPSN